MPIYQNFDPSLEDPPPSTPATPPSDDYGSLSVPYRSRSINEESQVNESHELSGEIPSTRSFSSREALIESIQRGEIPHWVSAPALGALIAKQNGRPAQGTQHGKAGDEDGLSESPLKLSVQEPQAIARPEADAMTTVDASPVDIERPRSAFHTGDFFQKRLSSHFSENETKPTVPEQDISASPESPSPTPIQPFDGIPFSPHLTCPSTNPYTSKPHTGTPPRPTGPRSRAPSLGSSLSSSFAYCLPTSPLAQAASNTESDAPAASFFAPQRVSLDRNTRRRTLPPDTFHHIKSGASSAEIGPPNFSRPVLRPRRESSLPYQAHQPRRSMTSASILHPSLSHPRTPSSAGLRRPSLSYGCSPTQHASMVGSFEESILRGRMSTAPSKPLNFVAQIGVLGQGDCKPSLKCPAHVTVPFPAVFYNYPSTGNTRSFSDDTPSPYVGTIDLEQSLKPIEPRRPSRRAPSEEKSLDALVADATAPANTRIGQAIDRKKRERQQKRSPPSHIPHGGCYRVPQQGQLQIIIKNPNKTAVKLYLVPYNLEGMEAGTKTFVRQRSFSAGPILERPLTDKPSMIVPDPLEHKSMLRYLIHLKFCCPSPGRYYLYDNIRVVFANRVPDGKEKLRNEVQLPDPRYSVYKPSREPSTGRTGAQSATEKPVKRRSSGFGHTALAFDAMDGLTFTGPAVSPSPPAPSLLASDRIPVEPRLGFNFSPVRSTGTNTSFPTSTSLLTATAQSTPHEDNANQPVLGCESGGSTHNEAVVTAGFRPSSTKQISHLPWDSFSLADDVVDGPPIPRRASPASPEPREGLLARELRTGECDRPANDNIS